MLKPSWIIKLLLLAVLLNKYSNSLDILNVVSDEILDSIIDNSEYVENGEPVKYNGAQLLRISIADESVKSVVTELQSFYDGQIWMESANEIDLLFMQQTAEDAQQILVESNIPYKVLIDDLQKAIDNENPPKEEIELRQKRTGHKMSWNKYYEISEIYEYLDYLTTTYPEFCSVSTIGKSIEGRPLKVLKISNGEYGNPGIWIDGGMNAREWISPATVTYIIEILTQNWESFPQYMRNIDWHILPISNPDGYQYSHRVDRFWKKSRRRSGSCFGVDLNRNFGYKWESSGLLSNPCSDIFPGNTAFSEPESQAIRDYLLKNKNNMKGYLTFHSYSQLFVYPWAYTKDASSDYMDLDLLAKRVAAKIQNDNGTIYKVGPSSKLLYPVGGTSQDWAKGVAGIKFSYTIKLRDTGRFGYLLPARFIEISGKEQMYFAETLAETISNLYSKN